MKYTLILLIAFSSFLFSQKWKDLSQQSDQKLAARQYEEAIRLSHEALKEVIKTYGKDDEYVITQYGKLGRAYFYAARLEEALSYYQKERALIEKLKGKENLLYGRVLNNISVVYNSIGRSGEVEKLLIESAEVKKKVVGEMDTAYAKTLNNLGIYYYERAKYPEAEGYLEKSLQIKLKSLPEESYTVGMSYLNLGNLFSAVGDDDKALENFNKAYNILKATRQVGDPDLLIITLKLGTFYSQKKKDLKTAEKYMSEAEKSLILNPNSINSKLASIALEIAMLKFRVGKYQEAQNILQPLVPVMQAKLGQSHPVYLKSIKTLGIALWQNGFLEEAYELFFENAEINKVVFGEKSTLYATAIHNFAGLLKDMEYYEEADAYYQEAFDIYLYQIQNYFPYASEAEKTKFYRMIKERFAMFNSYVLQRQLDRPEIIGDMYNYQVATKGILLDYSKNTLGLIEKSGDQELISQYKELLDTKVRLAELYNKNKMELEKAGIFIDDIENTANELEKAISLKINQYNPNNNVPPKWQEIQKKLKPNEAAVEIIGFPFFSSQWADSTFYAAVILTSETVNHPEIVFLDNGNVLNGKLLRRYKKQVKAKFPDKRTYLYFWSEIDEKLAGKDKIYLSADGVYNLINISSLMMPNNKYVLEEKTIVHLNNTKELLQKRPAKDTDLTISLFGNPAYTIGEQGDKKDEIKISPLPGTAIEIEKLKSIMDKNGTKHSDFVEQTASEENFKKAENSDIIHIATHGYFLSDLSELEGGTAFGVDVEAAGQNPLLRAGLLLSGASNFLNYNKASGGNNGIVTAYEIKNMDFRETDLVVMSACETGLGEVMNGEGVYGLQRAFQVAGANSIIMSLWTVDDKTTQELMVSFYDKYLSGQDIISSFRDARLEIKEKYNDPYYWGAFKLLGGLQ